VLAIQIQIYGFLPFQKYQKERPGGSKEQNYGFPFLVKRTKKPLYNLSLGRIWGRMLKI